MVSRARRWKRCVGLGVVLGTISAPAIAQSQKFVSQPAGSDEASASIVSSPMHLTADDIIGKMLERNLERSAALHQYSALRTYEIRNAKGKLGARTVVRVTYEAPDTKTFDKVSEQGSGIVRHLVFDRLMRTEGETASGREHHDSAITTANYTFALIGEEDIGQYQCFVLEAVPKRRDKYLFEGKIWVDAQDYAIVQIAGHPAKKPSFWVNRADFVRRYQKIDGFWLPYRDETSVEVKIYGRKTFTIDHRLYSINSSNPLQTRADAPDAPVQASLQPEAESQCDASNLTGNVDPTPPSIWMLVRGFVQSPLRASTLKSCNGFLDPRQTHASQAH